jgi:hypothetical protein
VRWNFFSKWIIIENSNTMELLIFFQKEFKSFISTSHNHEQNQKLRKRENLRFYGQKQILFWHFALQPLGNFSHVAAYRSSSKTTRKMNLQSILNKKFVTASYTIGICHTWCCKKACEICISFVQKKIIKINYYFSHMVPKHNTTSF